MKTSIQLKRIVTATSFALAVMVGAPVANQYLGFNGFDVISQAQAAEDGGGKGKMGSSDKGKGSKSSGGHDAGSTSTHGKDAVKVTGSGTGKGAGGDKATTSASKKGDKGMGGGGQPVGSGSKKGDLYGDLYVLIRDPITGIATTETILIEGVPTVFPLVQAFYVAADGVTLVPLPGVSIPRDVEGNLVTTATAVVGDQTVTLVSSPVDFGRLSVARAPSKVLDHSLAEAISKLAVADSITLDAAGRLVITAGGVTSTIDSPLENLALYQEIMALPPGTSTLSVTTTKVVDGVPTPTTVQVTLPLAMIPALKASLLAAAGDKYSTITLDTVMYMLPILKVTTDLSTYVYDRVATYSKTTPDVNDVDNDGNKTELEPIMITVLKLNTSTGSYDVVTVPVLDAVTFTDPTPETLGASAYADAVDDALQVLEFVHDNEVR